MKTKTHFFNGFEARQPKKLEIHFQYLIQYPPNKKQKGRP